MRLTKIMYRDWLPRVERDAELLLVVGVVDQLVEEIQRVAVCGWKLKEHFRSGDETRPRRLHRSLYKVCGNRLKNTAFLECKSLFWISDEEPLL